MIFTPQLRQWRCQLLSKKGMKTPVCLFLLFTVAIIADPFPLSLPSKRKHDAFVLMNLLSLMNHVQPQIAFFFFLS